MFFGVLDWGLGHATRSIPLIRAFLERGCRVTLGADGGALRLLRDEFPELQTVELPGYRVRYQSSGSLALAVARQLPKILTAMRREWQVTQRLLASDHVDLIVSDNRYGVRSPHVRSILVTHQLRLMLKWPTVRAVANAQLRRWIERFDEVWIPDVENAGDSLSGDLSRTRVSIPTRFIGPLSRFANTNPVDGSFEVVALVSGPEPQRSLLEEKLLDHLVPLGKRTLLLRGLPGTGDQRFAGMVEIRNHLPSAQLGRALASARFIIARAGYSTIMDLVALRKPALLVPTPGQPEQEHLAIHLADRGWFVFQDQQDLDIAHGLEILERRQPITNPYESDPVPIIASVDALMGA